MDKKQVLNYIILVILFLLSIYLTLVMAQEFPSIKISSSGEESNYSRYGKSPCSDKFANQYASQITSKTEYDLDENSIRIGDPIEIYSVIILEGEPKDFFSAYEYYFGIEDSSLKRVTKPKQKIELIYNSNQNITTYSVLCIDFTKMLKFEGDIILGSEFVKPSFVDSWGVKIVIFLTIFVLMGSFVEIIKKIISSKP